MTVLLPYSSSFLMAPSVIDRWEGSPFGNMLILLIPLNRIVMLAVHTRTRTVTHHGTLNLKIGNIHLKIVTQAKGTINLNIVTQGNINLKIQRSKERLT